MLDKILRRSSLYIGASTLSALLSLVTLPVYTRALSASDFGVLGVLMATFGVLSTLVGLNPALYLSARFKSLSTSEVKASVGAAMTTSLVMSAVLLAVLVLLGQRGLWPSIPGFALVVLAVLPVLSLVRTLGLTIDKMQERAGRVAANLVGLTALEHLAALLLVLGLGLGWQGRFLGTAGAFLLAALVTVVILVKSGHFAVRSDLATLRRYVGYSLPLLPHALGFWIIDSSDRYFLASMTGLESTGLYSVAYRVCGVFPIVASGVMAAFLPQFYEKTLDGAAKVAIVRFSYQYLAFVAVGTVVFVLTAPFVVPWLLGEGYRGTLVFVPWIALAYAFGSVRDLAAGYLYRAEKTRLLGALTLCAAGLNAGLNFLLIPWLGPVGAAVATAITYGILAVGTAWAGARAYHMPWFGAVDPRRTP